MSTQIFVLFYLLDTHQIFHNELLLNSRKDSCCRGSPRSFAIIRRQSVTAVSDRWVGLWVLSWLTDTKFHWQSEWSDLLNEQRHRQCWQADHGAAGRWKRQEETQRKKQRERARERKKGDWHVCVISLLLACFWSSRCCSADDETSAASSSHVMQDLPSSEHQGSTDTLVTSVPREENSPLHHATVSAILHVISADLLLGSCEAKTAQSLMCAES